MSKRNIKLELELFGLEVQKSALVVKGSWGKLPSAGALCDKAIRMEKATETHADSLQLH